MARKPSAGALSTSDGADIKADADVNTDTDAESNDADEGGETTRRLLRQASDVDLGNRVVLLQRKVGELQEPADSHALSPGEYRRRLEERVAVEEALSQQLRDMGRAKDADAVATRSSCGLNRAGGHGNGGHQ